jgi:hypothetical protein
MPLTQKQMEYLALVSSIQYRSSVVQLLTPLQAWQCFETEPKVPSSIPHVHLIFPSRAFH